jgi:hypothetical protein
MRFLDLSLTKMSLEELFNLAENETLILKMPNGEEFVFGELETEADFEREVEALSQNEEFMKFLAERGKDPIKHKLRDVIKRYEEEVD